jgi:hypothetical protein
MLVATVPSYKSDSKKEEEVEHDDFEGIENFM